MGGDLHDDASGRIYLVFLEPAPDTIIGRRIATSSTDVAAALPQGVIGVPLAVTEMPAALITGVVRGVAFADREEAIALSAADARFRAYALEANNDLTPITGAPDPEPAEPSDPALDLSDVAVGLTGGSGITSAGQLDGRTVAVAGNFDTDSVDKLAQRLEISFAAVRPVEDLAPGFETPSAASIAIQDLPQALLDQDIAAVFVADVSLQDNSGAALSIERAFARFDSGDETFAFVTATELLADAQGPGGTLAGLVADASGSVLDDVVLTFTANDGAVRSVTSDGAGVFSLENVDAPGGRLTAMRDYDPVKDGAITAGDALEALRISVGLEPSFGPAQGQHFIAADFNGDGQVTAGDALDILRVAVGLQAEYAPRWVFLDAATDWDGVVQGGQIDYQPGIAFGPLAGETEMGLTGILIGSLTEVV